MDWIQTLTIAGSTIGACWLMHRQNIKESRERQKQAEYFNSRHAEVEDRYHKMIQNILEKKDK